MQENKWYTKDNLRKMQFREIHQNIMFLRYQNPKFKTHLHEDIELLYSIKGGATAYCNGKSYELKDGDLFVAFPNQLHYYTGDAKGDYILLIIKPSQLLAFANVFLDYEPESAVVNLSDNDSILRLLEMALGEYMTDGYSAVLEAYITTIFGKAINHFHLQKTGVSRNKIAKVLYYCSKHYKENISIDDIANALNISRSTVSHAFCNHLKIGFCNYINTLRLVEARRLLRNTDMSITDIAQSVGFETIRTFNRAFLKEQGITPTEYRKSRKNKGTH